MDGRNMVQMTISRCLFSLIINQCSFFLSLITIAGLILNFSRLMSWKNRKGGGWAGGKFHQDINYCNQMSPGLVKGEEPAGREKYKKQ
jgi:hypothetical protein